MVDIEMPKAFEVASQEQDFKSDGELSPAVVDNYRLLAVVDSARTFSSNDVSLTAAQRLSDLLCVFVVHLPRLEAESNITPFGESAYTAAVR